MTKNTLEKMVAITKEHQALAVLRHLSRAQGFRSNEQLLAIWMNVIGVSCYTSELKELLVYLENSGLIVTETVESVCVASLTKIGEETADGRRIVEGVLRPPPDCAY